MNESAVKSNSLYKKLTDLAMLLVLEQSRGQ